MALGRTVGELANSLSSYEFSEWQAYYSVEPWGEATADARHGILASLIANSNRDARKQPQPFRPEQFMLRTTHVRDPRGESRSQWEVVRDRFRALVRK